MTGPAPGSETLPLPQQAIYNKFYYVTGLAPQFAINCLQQCNWDYDRAINMFMEAKVRLSRCSCNMVI
jgi:hypothetical protein